MSDPVDELERRLRAAVRAHAPAVRRRARRWPLVAVAAALAVSGGGALAASKLATGGPHADAEGRRIAFAAAHDTRDLAACRRLGRGAPAYVPGLPHRGILAVLPALGRPASSASVAAARRYLDSLHLSGRTLAVSPRTIAFGDGLRLVVAVREGEAFGAITDPAACAAARRRRADVLAHGRSRAVVLAAHRRLAQLRDTVPGLQSVELVVGRRGGSYAGVGLPVAPGARLPVGPVLGGSTADRRGGSVYTGVAGPRAVSARVLARHRVAGTPRRAGIRDGFYVVALPRGTGPARVVLRDAAGRVVRVDALRR